MEVPGLGGLLKLQISGWLRSSSVLCLPGAPGKVFGESCGGVLCGGLGAGVANWDSKSHGGSEVVLYYAFLVFLGEFWVNPMGEYFVGVLELKSHKIT